MSQSKPSRKDVGDEAEPLPARSLAGQAARQGAHTPATPASTNAGFTFDAVLRRVIGLAQDVLSEPRRKSSSAELAAARGVARERPPSLPTAQQTLAQALEKLAPELALKLRTVMVAGRDGRRITDVQVNMSIDDADSAFKAAARDLSENGPLLADYLRRGHAMACAAGLDVEKPFADWPSPEPHSVEERDWLSFGRQLAMSNVEDWTYLAIAAPAVDTGEQLTRLYLGHGDLAWWSFQTTLERPSADVVDRQRGLGHANSEGVAMGSLKELATLSCTTEGRALRRAVRAVRARVGYLGSSR